jgi:hypothetical protein
MLTSRTIDTLLIPLPVSGGFFGTLPRSGHSTRNSASSTRNASPVARCSRRILSRSSSPASATYPGPGPAIPGSKNRPIRYRPRRPIIPAA